MPQAPPEWVASASQRAAGADRAATGATSSARSSRCARSPDAYLYTIRLVDPEVIKARQIVTANTDEYRGLEANRTTTQIAFALLYLGLTLIIVLSAIWTGIAVADRLVRPIRQLIGAADEVATGNLDVTVPGARRPTATSPRSATPSTRCCRS